MGGETAIVSASNALYFVLLEGLILSLEQAKLPGNFHLCVYDVGLDPQQVETLIQRNVSVVSPSWSINFPGSTTVPEWFRAMTNRPMLPRQFPGYDTYIWIDADAWIQQPNGIYAALEAAQHGSIAIVAERFGIGTIFPVALPDGGAKLVRMDETSIRRNITNCYVRCFGPEYGYRGQQMIINTGFFALRGNSPIWETWLEYIKRGVTRHPHKLVEQQAMNLAILDGTISAQLLPNRYNWNLAAIQPLYDAVTGKLVDPEDRKPLGLVHLTDLKALTHAPIADQNGKPIRLPLRYQDFQAYFLQRDQTTTK